MARKQRVTLDDVAREAGVSTMTVSRVVNNTGRISEATRQHVQAIITRLGYRPSRYARALVTRKTGLLGVIVPDITNPYFSKIVQGIETVATEADYSVLLVNTNETQAREEAALTQLDDSTIDGLILCSSRLPEETLLPLLERQRCVVAVTRPLPQHMASCVLPRHEWGYRAVEAFRYLVRHGHERIGMVYLKRHFITTYERDFIEHLANEGIMCRKEWTIGCLPNWEAGYDAAKELLTAQPHLTAIVGGNDLVALGTMHAAVELGRRIPDDLAVIGGDDILIARQVTPPLTTFRAPRYEIGAMAARLLFKRMEGDTTYREFIYDEELVERGSAP